ncbi:MAG: RNase adapter RapZ [Selenomonadaceae bacterium]|nr:RNase adapter RapZ [Selenomonadaceae bacterium]
MLKVENCKAGGNRLVIVTGLSGSGKTQACRYLEDMGYFVVDNLPPLFIPRFAELCRDGSQGKKSVLVVDTRSGEFFNDFVKVLEELKEKEVPYELLFMQASDAAIIRRYKETRRSHPMAPSSRISEGVTRERERLAPVLELANYTIDTSEMRKTALKEKLVRLFGEADGKNLSINVLSFGYKFGVPLDADLVFDVRFLPNPFYLDELKHKSGTVPAVAGFINSYPVTHDFLKKLDDLLSFLVPQYIAEGKSQLVIALGCTGGMHRSVFVARHVAEMLTAAGYPASLEHRDLQKNDVREHVETE